MTMRLATTLLFLQWLLVPVVFADESGEQPRVSLSDQVWHYLTDGASITAGLGGRTISIDVTRKGTDDHGKMAEHNEDAQFLSYNTKASYFGQSNFGYSWMFNLSTFHLRAQERPSSETVNMGTEVEGIFAYAVPSIFYNFGDRHRGLYLRTGIGLGMGLAEFNGDVILTESSRANDRVEISNGTSNLFFALGLFVDFQWNYFTFRFASAGPNLEYDGYDINIADTSLMLGLSYYLD